MSQAFAMIMAGGESPDLSVLTEIRAEPAVPFGGKFRLVDFSLSNCVNSGIHNVAILTQYRPRSLNDHIGIGKPWDLDRAKGGVRLLQPYQGGPFGGWQRGSADAVRRNLDYVLQQPEERVLILSGRHIYLMDYRPMLEFHIQSRAEVTVAVRRVSRHETYRFGIVRVDGDGRIRDFQEKPRRAPGNVANMGVYVFDRAVLVDALLQGDHVDFGHHLLPEMVRQHRRVFAYFYPGYWADVGTVQAYWEANMGLLAEEPALDLYDPEWVVHTRSYEKAPVKLGPQADVDGTILSNGCQIFGVVERSVIAPGVVVEPGARVRDSVILNDTVIRADAEVERCIVDKEAVIGVGARVGHGERNTPNKELPERLNTGLTLIGKGSRIPDRMVLGRNVIVHPGATEADFGRRKSIRSGSSVGRSQRNARR